jgi:pimeloyl-ACP methyl ester carboxylesterase
MRGVTAIVQCANDRSPRPLRELVKQPRGFLAPSEVPESVDDEMLAAALASGRPQGTQGLLDVDGIGCPTFTAGEGLPMLCVHGLGHDAWDWSPFFVRCSGKAHLVALDLPGFGLADKPADRRWDLEILVRAVIAAAEKMPSPPVVVASSLGGHVALLAAFRQPRLFSKLVLCAPGGLVQVNALSETALRAYYSVDSIAGRREADIVGNSRRIFARPGNPFDDQLAARKLAVHRSAHKREFAIPFAGIVDDVFRHVVIKRLGELRVPSLFLSGSRDVVVPPDVVAAAARGIGARFVQFDDVGHCPHLEAPDAFADAVMSFAVA